MPLHAILLHAANHVVHDAPIPKRRGDPAADVVPRKDKGGHEAAGVVLVGARHLDLAASKAVDVERGGDGDGKGGDGAHHQHDGAELLRPVDSLAFGDEEHAHAQAPGGSRHVEPGRHDGVVRVPDPEVFGDAEQGYNHAACNRRVDLESPLGALAVRVVLLTASPWSMSVAHHGCFFIVICCGWIDILGGESKRDQVAHKAVDLDTRMASRY